MKKLISVLLVVLMALFPVSALADAGNTNEMVVTFSSPMEGMDWLKELFLLEEDGEGEDGTSYLRAAVRFAEDELFNICIASDGEDAPFYVQSNALGDGCYQFTAEDAEAFVMRFAQKLADMGILPQEMLDEIMSADADGDSVPDVSGVLSKIDIDPMPIVEAFMQIVSNAEFTTEESEDEEVAYVTYGTIGREDIWNLVSALLEAAQQLPENAPVSVEIPADDMEALHQAFLNKLADDVYVEIGMSEEDMPLYAWVDVTVLNGEDVPVSYALYFESDVSEEGTAFDLYLMTGDPDDEESLTSLAYATLNLSESGTFAALYIGDPATQATSVTLTVEPETETANGTMRNTAFAITGIEGQEETEIASLLLTNEKYDNGFNFTATVHAFGEELGTMNIARENKDGYTPAEHGEAMNPMELDDDAFEGFCNDVLNNVMSFVESVINKFVPAET